MTPEHEFDMEAFERDVKDAIHQIVVNALLKSVPLDDLLALPVDTSISEAELIREIEDDRIRQTHEKETEHGHKPQHPR